MAIGTSTVLVVEGGIHQAARVVLAPGWIRVGASPDNDVVVSDLATSGTCFTLEHRGRDVVLHATEAPIEYPGSRLLERGESRRCAAGVCFTSGGIAFRLEVVALVPGRGIGLARPKLSRRMAAVAIGVLSAIILTALVSLSAAPAVQSDAEIETTGSISPSSGRPTLSSLQGQSLALERLRRHLATVELSSLVLTAEPDGSIEARGQISKSQEATWHEVERWFDASAAAQVVLVNAVSVVAEPQPLTIQAVWPGLNPYVIDSGGGKHFIGTVLPSGWTIADIDRTHVLVKRGDQVLSVRF
jgi:type III secretion protein D